MRTPPFITSRPLSFVAGVGLIALASSATHATIPRPGIQARQLTTHMSVDGV